MDSHTNHHLHNERARWLKIHLSSLFWQVRNTICHSLAPLSAPRGTTMNSAHFSDSFHLTTTPHSTEAELPFRAMPPPHSNHRCVVYNSVKRRPPLFRRRLRGTGQLHTFFKKPRALNIGPGRCEWGLRRSEGCTVCGRHVAIDQPAGENHNKQCTVPLLAQSARRGGTVAVSARTSSEERGARTYERRGAESG